MDATLKWDSGIRDLWNSAIGLYKVWVVHLGRRYGLLRTLADRALKPDELAEELSLSKEAVALWCDAAYSLGILDIKANGYTVPRRLRPHLTDEGDVRFISGLMGYLALRSLDFDAFDLFFRGKNNLSQPHMREAFDEGTIWDHIAFTNILLRKEKALRRKLENGARVLDAGCGSGNWSIKLAKMFPRSEFVGIDPDAAAVRAARKKAGNLNNTRFEVGRIEAASKHGFDVVYLGEVLYAVPERGKAEVLSTCYQALRDDGFFVICETYLDGRKRSLENKVMYPLQLDYALHGGRSFRKSELLRLVRDAGFSKPKFYDLGGGLSFVVGRK